ncbi:C6 zinc finger domain protein [Colletotrichum tabaci]|uniref:C6 zinc finger domain protein n=1 Tax=Colletotrichum tabaci TaxID=1209068 RepID=A0AAV9SYW6_9PEZI
MVHLLTTYRTSVATWMDIFDYGCAYQLEVLRRCMTSKLLICSVCAFTAKHLSLLPSGDVWVAPATRYYGESLRGLIGSIGTGSVPEDVLTATILLCSYEIIATQGEEHQRHLSGAKLLILNRGVSASSVGLDRANFWIYIRHEITVALFNKTTLQISPRDWRVNWRETEVEEDVLANQLLWLLGRAIDVVFRQEQSVFTTTTTLCDERQEIYAEVATWFRSWSPSFKGVKYGEPDDQGFSKLYFPMPCAVQIENHALEIGCIMLSDIPNSVRSFSSQAIFYAAKHITGISRKIRLWNMLDDVEIRLGFRTRDQVKKLKELVETNI